MTAVGAMTFRRVYFVCPQCESGRYAADARLGIDGFLTLEARRLVCLAGGQRSFENAELLLKELCGWRVGDERIRQACHAEAGRIEDWRGGGDPAVANAFRAAAGEPEFQTDATEVNTTSGWKDLKIGLFAKRPLGPSAGPDEWEQRDLPKPTARVAFAAIEEIGEFAPRWGEWAERLGLTSFTGLSVIADGAEWIWNAAESQFPGYRGALDIFHACEHLGDAANGLFGEGTEAARTWREAGRRALLGDGWYGLTEFVAPTLATPVTEAGRTALDGMLAYFAKHTGRLNYCLRLKQGRAIGSGQIEGACKNMIGRRMKQSGARWTAPNANRMAELCSLSYSAQWGDYWTAA